MRYHLPKPRGSELPLWYPLNSGSLSVPQLLYITLLSDKRHKDKHVCKIYIPYWVNSIVAFWAKVQTVLSTGLLGASVVSWTRKDARKSLRAYPWKLNYSGVHFIYHIWTWLIFHLSIALILQAQCIWPYAYCKSSNPLHKTKFSRANNNKSRTSYPIKYKLNFISGKSNLLSKLNKPTNCHQHSEW